MSSFVLPDGVTLVPDAAGGLDAVNTLTGERRPLSTPAAHLIAEGWLVPGHDLASAFGTLSAQHQMLRDPVRVLAYRSAIFAHARDKSVLDLGCGTGLLSVFAAQAGARRVFAIEQTRMASLARLMFKANRCEDRVALFAAHSRAVELPERAEVLVHELLGTDPFSEDLLPTLADARARLLAPGGRLIPHRLEVCAVGIESPFVPSLAERTLAEAAELGGLYGVDFTPYQAALEAGTSLLRLDPPSLGQSGEPASSLWHTILSDECRLVDIDLNGDLEAPLRETVLPLHIAREGRLGAMLLFFRAHLDEHLVLSTSPFSARTHWGWGLRELSRSMGVHAGDLVELTCSVETVHGRQTLLVDLR